MNTVASSQARIGVLKERAPGERRVALVRADIKRLGSKGTFRVERGAGSAAGYDDSAYEQAGALVVGVDTMLQESDILLGVRPPQADLRLREGTVVISLGGRDAELAAALRVRRVTFLGLERLPRTTRAQAMDVLSSQAGIAGYGAVIEGARMLGVLLPMMTTAAGIIKPARMIALGAGVAGLQAIATARRLGAVVHGFDVREAAREQVESLAAKFVFPNVEMSENEGTGGYAGEQTADQQLRLRRALGEQLSTMHLVVASAQIPGRPAPLLIDDETLAGMQPGAVIIDLAAETGGNCSATRPDEVVTVHGVRIFGPTHMPSQTPTDASRLFSGNLRALLEHLIDAQGTLRLDALDPIIAALLAGQPVAEAAAPVAEAA